MVSPEKYPVTYLAMTSGCKSLLKNHVCSELYLKYLKMVATVADQRERSAGKEVNRDIRITTVNVGTMRGRSNEIVEMLSRRLTNICCLQESKWRGESARKILTTSFSRKGIILVVEV